MSVNYCRAALIEQLRERYALESIPLARSNTVTLPSDQHSMPRRRKDMDLDSDDFSMESTKHKPVQRSAANARERARMRVLSKAFSKLKTTLPWVPPDTKLSKLDTLRLAASYIAHLRQILDTEEVEGPQHGYIHPINLTWPFTFNGRVVGLEGKSPDSLKHSPKADLTGNAKC